jgi:importin subunit alpha-6/7
VLPCLLAMLSSPKKGIRKEACWTVSNITAGNRQQVTSIVLVVVLLLLLSFSNRQFSRLQIQQVIDSGIIPRLLQLAANGNDFDIVKEAIWAVSNATSGGSPEQLAFLVSHGCMSSFCKVLNGGDSRILQVALEGIDNLLKTQALGKEDIGAHSVLEAEGGIDALEMLQTHNNAEVAAKALHILSTYFDAEEDADADAGPGAGGDNVMDVAAQLQNVALGQDE